MAKRAKDLEKEEYWRLVVEEFEKSGLTVRQFCRREKLREPSFYAWRRELRRRDGDQRADGIAPVAPALVEVMTRSPTPAQAIEIETPAGFTIRLGEQVDRELMTSVLSSMLPLEKGPC